jgi:hypothetical protein
LVFSGGILMKINLSTLFPVAALVAMATLVSCGSNSPATITSRILPPVIVIVDQEMIAGYEQFATTTVSVVNDAGVVEPISQDAEWTFDTTVDGRAQNLTFRLLSYEVISVGGVFTFSFTPSVPGSYSVKANVKLGSQTSTSLPVTFTVSPSPAQFAEPDAL